MPKNVLKVLSIILGILFLYGCAATKNVEVRSYTEVKDRIDQNMEEGNAGYIFGTPQSEDRSGIRKTRKIYVLEVSKGMDEEEVVVESEDAMGESGDEEFLYKKPSYKESLYEEEDTDYDYGDMTPPKETRIPSAGVSKEAVTPLPSSSEYTVQKGDTLQKISKKFYDSYSKWPKIYEANKSVISDPDKIKPGIVLQIPMQ